MKTTNAFISIPKLMKNGFKQLLTHGFTRPSSVESRLTTRHRLSDYLMDVSCHASEIKEQAQDP